MGPHDLDAADVGARLRGAREAAGLTQTDAAADLRVARTTLTRRWFEANGGITNEQARQVLGEPGTVDTRGAQRPVSFRLELLAAEAQGRELLSEGQLARLLRLDRIELRKMLDDADIKGNDRDGPPKLP